MFLIHSRRHCLWLTLLQIFFQIAFFSYYKSKTHLDIDWVVFNTYFSNTQSDTDEGSEANFSWLKGAEFLWKPYDGRTKGIAKNWPHLVAIIWPSDKLGLQAETINHAFLRFTGTLLLFWAVRQISVLPWQPLYSSSGVQWYHILPIDGTMWSFWVTT